MATVNRNWLQSRDSDKPRVRLGFRMLDDRSRFKAGREYYEPYSIAHGLVDAGLAVFLDDEDNSEATAPREQTLKELQDRASSLNLPVSDTYHRRPRTTGELRADLAKFEELSEVYSKLQVRNLRQILSEEGLAVSGNKAELAARLAAHRVRVNRG